MIDFALQLCAGRAPETEDYAIRFRSYPNAICAVETGNEEAGASNQ
jgi:hypothetical protein